MPLGIPRGARCVQRFDDSLNSAIHITYRISLRSSSMREPRDPLLKVILYVQSSIPYKDKFVCDILKRAPPNNLMQVHNMWLAESTQRCVLGDYTQGFCLGESTQHVAQRVHTRLCLGYSTQRVARGPHTTCGSERESTTCGSGPHKGCVWESPHKVVSGILHTTCGSETPHNVWL